MRSTNRPPVITQLGALKAKFPDSSISWRSNVLTWTGSIQPTALSRTYTVRIVWRPQGRADVTIVDPAIPTTCEPPHVFAGNHPCVHLPGEWTSSTPIADTIIPWTSEWLLFYELWQITGEWLGGGHEPIARGNVNSPQFE